MATAINDLLKFNPEHFTDPVPPWFLEILVDKTVLRDLALVSLEHNKSLQELNIKRIDSAIAIIRKAKL